MIFKGRGRKYAKCRFWNLNSLFYSEDRLCGLVVRVPGYRSRGPGIDSRRYQIFWEVVGLERGPLGLVSTTEELLGRNSSGSGLENREYGRGDLLRCPRDTLYPQKLALTSPTSGDRSAGIVRFRTKTTEFVLFVVFWARSSDSNFSVVCGNPHGWFPITSSMHGVKAETRMIACYM
jgi:hypothetical protein